MKYGSEFKHGFTNRACLHCDTLNALHGFQEKRTHKSKDMQFFLQNVSNEISEIFKMFKNNMNFTRASCWINSKISNRDKNNTLIIYLICHYCWSLLWCDYWKSLKSGSHLPINMFYFLQWKPLKNDEKCFYKTCSFSRYLNFCVKVSFTTLLTNNYITHIAQYLTK